MKKVLVLSVPHTGTHFTVWLLRDVYKLDVRFHHFHPNSSHLVTECLSNLDPSVSVVVPTRNGINVRKSYESRGLSDSELAACKKLQKYFLDEFKHIDWVLFNISWLDEGRRRQELSDLVNSLGVEADNYRLDRIAGLWPKIRKSDMPDMHKFVWKEGDFRSPNQAHREFTLDQWVDFCHGRSVENGWWRDNDPEDPNVAAAKIALIHSEVSEMLEGLRKGHHDDHLPDRRTEEVEAADIFIRLMDYCGARSLDILNAAIEKMAYNETRADHKPAARAAAEGKKF